MIRCSFCHRPDPSVERCRACGCYSCLSCHHDQRHVDQCDGVRRELPPWQTPMMTPKPRPSYAEELAELVAELTDAVLTRERWLREAPKGQPRVLTDHPLIHAGLLIDLEEALQPSQQPVDQPGGSGGFAARPPVRHEALEMLDEITEGAAELRRELRGSGRTHGDSSTVIHDLRELVALVSDPETPPSTKRRVVSEVRTWVRKARVIVAHDAPILTLRDVYCPYCGSDLRVRADASSDVWCSGMVRVSWCDLEDHADDRYDEVHPAKHKIYDRVDCVDKDGKRHTWARGSWFMLLDRMEEATA